MSIFLLLLAVFIISGCGRKGEPRPLWPESKIGKSFHRGGY
jgi:predicted small lipoprotein YifL